MNGRIVWAAALALGVVGLGLMSADPVRAALERQVDPPRLADRSMVAAQREAAEHALGRGYANALAQVRSTGNVRLPVTVAQAESIQQRALTDLQTVRRAALADLASAAGITGTAATAYVGATERMLDGAATDAKDPGVLLAPTLFAIVTGADVLFGQVADRATRELTTAPATPAPSR